jgi:hypothetical protein
MWALDIVFSTVEIRVLVAQAPASSVEVPGVLRLHALVLGSIGVMFTSSLDLCRASLSSHKVLDELYPKVFI